MNALVWVGHAFVRKVIYNRSLSLSLSLLEDKGKEGKASGEDGISAEVMKRVDLDDITLKFYNDPLCGGDLPDQWKTYIIIPIPKKGDLAKTDSYRGIALTSIPGKILNRMILKGSVWSKGIFFRIPIFC